MAIGADVKIITDKLTGGDHDCPQCGKTLDGFTGTDGVKPTPDDVGICCYCSAVLQYNDDLSYRFAEADVVAQVTLELSRLQRVVKEVRKKGV